MKQYFCVGTYTEPILFGTGEVFEGKGKGVLICAFEDGQFRVITEIAVRNPSYLCIDQERKKIYTVNEMKEYLNAAGGGVTQIAFDEDWQMNIEDTCNIQGTDPCHILLSPDHSFLSIANFASGSVTMVPLDDAGNLLAQQQLLFQHQGSSIDQVRQQGPHAHATIAAAGQSLFYVPDLGADTVFAYSWEYGQMRPNKEACFTVPAGSGPRTGVFSAVGQHFYLICEISSQIIHYRYQDGRMIAQEIVDTLELQDKTGNICSDLALTPDGAYLYASNRGHDSLACYQVGEDGSLSLIERISCGGKTPRNFTIDPTGCWLLCGNQDSDTISIFAIGQDGRLTLTNTQYLDAPVCIRFF